MMRRTRGYTIVELMMALAVFATGVTGIIAMQRATVASNQLAKNVTIATGIGQAWLSQLSADATLWNRGTNVTSTTWLGSVATAQGVWQLPAYDATRAFGAQFDGFGKAVTANELFCAQIRLTWLYGDASPIQSTGIAGNGVIRSEVRVFWLREGKDPIANACTTATQAKVDELTANADKYHWVVLVGAVRQG